MGGLTASPGETLQALKLSSEMDDKTNGHKGANRQYQVLLTEGDLLTGFAALLLLNDLFAVVERYEKTASSGLVIVPETGQILLLQDSRLPVPGSPIVSIDWAANGAQAATSGTRHIPPCHYFDYFVGNGAAGLIAIMLGRLRMSIEEATTRYTKLFDFARPSPKYGTGRREAVFTLDIPAAVNCILQGYCRNEFPDFPFMVDRYELSKTLIVAAETKARATVQHIVRSYAPPAEHRDSSYDNFWHLSTQNVCEICLADYTLGKYALAGKLVLANRGLLEPAQVSSFVLDKLGSELGSHTAARFATVLELQAEPQRSKSSMFMLPKKPRKHSSSSSSSSWSWDVSGLGSRGNSMDSGYVKIKGKASLDSGYAQTTETSASAGDGPGAGTADQLHLLVDDLRARLVLSFADDLSTISSVGKDGKTPPEPSAAQIPTQLRCLAQAYLSQKDVRDKIEVVANNLVQCRRLGQKYTD